MNRPKMSDKDYSLLFDACHMGNVKLIRAVCDYENINYQNEDGYTLLSIACMRNDILMIKSLLKFLPNPNIKTNDGFSPLIFCIKNNNLEAIKLLFENGAIINDQKGIGLSMIYACSYGFDEIIDFLIEKGAKLNSIDSEKNNLLMIAAKEGFLKIVKYLIEKNIDINSTNKFGNNALMFAIKSNHIDIVQTLIENEIDINAYNKEGTTALMLAVQYKRYNIINELLLIESLNINQIDYDGCTALMYSCLIEDIKSMAFLLDNKKTNINKTNHNNETALMIAIKKDNEEITSLLLSKMADVQIKNIHGDNAFKLAAMNGNFKIAKMIMDYSPIDIDSYDKDLIESYKENILKLEEEIINKEKSTVSINLDLDNDNAFSEIKLAINKLEDLSKEILENNIDTNKTTKFNFIPNDKILKNLVKEEIDIFIEQKKVDDILSSQSDDVNVNLNIKDSVNLKVKEIEFEKNLFTLDTQELEEQKEIIECIDNSIFEILTIVKEHNNKKTELEQKWLNLNIEEQREILENDNLTILEKMDLWIKFVEKTKIEWSPTNRFENDNELIIIENNNMEIDEEKYREKVYAYWEKIQNTKRT